MKKIFTLLFLITLASGYISAQTVLWGGPTDKNSAFIGGMNDWTTVGINADSSIWEWVNRGDGRKGAYWGTLSGINSPTGTTGAMIFNSDFLDNAGVQGNFGGGKSPSPHSGALISPIIDCSTFNSVAFSFYNYYRNFDSHCFVEVSVDGGANWISRKEVNADVASGVVTARNNRKLFDFTEEARGQKTVQFRFVFEGEYYFWIIDDVTLVTLPDNDLNMLSAFYTPAAYKQPISQICQDTFVFSATVSNVGGMKQENVVIKGEVLDIDKKTVLYVDSLLLPEMDITFDDTTFRTPNYFVPDKLDYGRYFLRWSIYSLKNRTDFSPVNNTRLDSFEITATEFAREPRATSGLRAGAGASYTAGCMYRTSDCWGPKDQFLAKSADFAVVTNQNGTLNGYATTVYLVEVNDDIAEDWSNFDNTMPVLSNPSVTLLSAESWEGTTEASGQLINVPLTDFNTAGDVLLKPKHRYFLLIEHPAESGTSDTYRFHAISNEKNYQNQAFAVTVIDASGRWFNGWASGQVHVARLNIEMKTKTDDQPLAENVISVSPNPVTNDILQVNLNFDNATQANLTVFDMTGKLKSFESYENVTKDQININTTELSAGEYFVRVSTNDGTRTVKFAVVK